MSIPNEASDKPRSGLVRRLVRSLWHRGWMVLYLILTSIFMSFQAWKRAVWAIDMFCIHQAGIPQSAICKSCSGTGVDSATDWTEMKPCTACKRSHSANASDQRHLPAKEAK
jgi:hypothetical protein